MAGAVRLYQEVLQLVRGEIGNLPSGEEALPLPGTASAAGGEAAQGQVIVLSDIVGEALESEALHLKSDRWKELQKSGLPTDMLSKLKALL